MEAATPRGGQLVSRSLWIAVATLTSVGVVGILVLFVGFVINLGPVSGGCALAGLGFLLLFLALALTLIYAAVIGGLTAAGLILFRRGSRWGPGLLIGSNLLTMAYFFWSPVGPGQVAWAAGVILLAAAPALAVVLLVWFLLSQGIRQARIAELIVLGVIAVPLVSAYVYGISTDVAAALMPVPQPVASVPAGCAGSGPAPAAVKAP
jgi:hypothetical protein